MAIAKDLDSKLNSSFIESSSTPRQPLLAICNPDGSTISGASSSFSPRSGMNIPYDLVSLIASSIIESASTNGQAALVVGNSDGSNI